MSGVDVRDQYAYTALMASRRETILTNFKRRGYRTVALMPGMRQAWPEGAFYGFDVIYGRDLLEYEGPQFGWWSIPDQYALAKLDALERRRSPRAPLLVVFPTSTTHAPFGPVAPYQPDWSRLLTKNAYDEADVERAMAVRPDLTNLGPSYVRAMAYEYGSFAGYLRQQADEAVMIVIGDHQPPAAVSGKDASWRVPVHVITSRRAVLHRLLEHGFRPGLQPQRPSIGAMHALVPMLLEAFDATDDPADEVP
jgi:phosphoglycerol transferase MdoB-like AlkP superfamily enzyme